MSNTTTPTRRDWTADKTLPRQTCTVCDSLYRPADFTKQPGAEFYCLGCYVEFVCETMAKLATAKMAKA